LGIGHQGKKEKVCFYQTLLERENLLIKKKAKKGGHAGDADAL